MKLAEENLPKLKPENWVIYEISDGSEGFYILNAYAKVDTSS